MEQLKRCLLRLTRRQRRADVEDPLQGFKVCNSSDSDKAETAHNNPQRKLDGGYGWVVVFASFLAHVTIYGVSWSVGMFNIMFLETFQQSKSATAWVGSLLNALLFASGLLSSALVARFGCRPVLIAGGLMAAAGIALSALASRLFVLYITFSGLGGVGLGLAYVPAIVCVCPYFERHRTIAFGLAVSGVGLGGFLFPPVIRALMELYNWQVVLLTIAGIVATTLTFSGALMVPTEQTAEPAYQSGYFTELKSSLRVMKSIPMIVLGANNALFCFGQAIVYVHLGAFAVSAGIVGKSNTAAIFSIIGVSNLAGRVIHGVICHFPGMATTLVYMASTLVSGVATLLITSCTGVTSLAVCASLFGFSSSCVGVLLPDIIIGLVGERRLTSTYGWLMVLEGAGFMLGGPTAGLLYDRSLTYNSSFCLAGLVLVLSALLVLVPWRYSRAPSPPPDPDREAAAGLASPIKVPAQPSDFLLPPEAGPAKPVLSQHGRPCDEAMPGLEAEWAPLHPPDSSRLHDDAERGQNDSPPDGERAPLCPPENPRLQEGTERGQDKPPPDGERAPLCPPENPRLQEGTERGQDDPPPDGERAPLCPPENPRLQEGTERGQDEPPPDGERAPLCPPENPRLQDVPVSGRDALDTRARPGRLRSPGAAARREAATGCDPVPALRDYWNQPIV